MNKKSEQKKWKRWAIGLISVVASGYGVNLAVGPSGVPTPEPVEQKEVIVLEYFHSYEMEDGRKAVLNLDGVTYYPE